jgi:hypothetical protein
MMAQSTKIKTKNTTAPKVVVNKKLNITSKKKKILKSTASRTPLKDFTIDDLHQNQKLILKEFITSVDNTPRLKEFYTNKIIEIKEELTSLGIGSCTIVILSLYVWRSVPGVSKRAAVTIPEPSRDIHTTP